MLTAAMGGMGSAFGNAGESVKEFKLTNDECNRLARPTRALFGAQKAA